MHFTVSIGWVKHQSPVGRGPPKAGFNEPVEYLQAVCVQNYTSVMSKKQISILLVLVVLAGAAAYLLKDWFKPESIQISCLIRPAPPGRRPQPSGTDAPSGKPGYNVAFAFNHKLALTAIKVFPLADAMTNKYPRPLWSLASPSNSVPTKSIVYGDRIRGLPPVVKGATADPLEAGGAYRLVIEAGDVKAQQDFQIPR